MDAQVEKKSFNDKVKTFKQRFWRIRDRRLIQYNSSCAEWSDCVPKNIKFEVDLALMSFCAFYPKEKPKPNLLQIKHPKIGHFVLRFTGDKTDRDVMASWLKVLTSWGVDRKRNRIYVAIASNFSYAMWCVLYALYQHEEVLTTEGIFRRDTSVTRKAKFCNDLLYETLGIADIQRDYNEVLLLGKTLQYMLLNLPCSLFGDDNFDDLVRACQTLQISNVIDAAKQREVDESELDSDVANMTSAQLKTLRECIARMHAGKKNRHRYGLIALTLQLLKQITLHSAQNRMTCHAMARLFVMCFESKSNTAQLLKDPMRSVLLIKALIFHAYYLFPSSQSWKMADIVVAEKQEKLTMEKYGELQLSKKQKQNWLKSIGTVPPTKHFNADSVIDTRRFQVTAEMRGNDSDAGPAGNDDDDDEKYAAPRRHAQQLQMSAGRASRAQNLSRYLSHDDLDIGGLEKKEDSVVIAGADSTGDYARDRRFAVLRSAGRKSLRAGNFAKQLSVNDTVGKHQQAPHYRRERSLSVPHLDVVFPKITEVSSAVTTTKHGTWNPLKQSQISEFQQPCYVRDDSNHTEYIYFISSADRECWRYNVGANTFSLFMRFPEYFRLQSYAMCCNAYQQRLFVYGEATQFAELKHIHQQQQQHDNSTKQWLWNDENAQIFCDSKYNKELQSKFELQVSGHGASAVFIDNDIAEMHVVGGKLSSCHFRWDERSLRMVTLCRLPFSGIEGHATLYVANEWNKPMRSKLLLLGGYAKYASQKSFAFTDAILCCDVRAESDGSVWTALNGSHSLYSSSSSDSGRGSEKEIKLPMQMAFFGAVVYRHVFVILFGGRDEQNRKLDAICYLNLNTLQWTTSALKCPAKTRGYFAVLTSEPEVVHLFQRDSEQHFAVKVTDVIPAAEINAAERQQQQQYKLYKIKMDKKSTVEIGRTKQDIGGGGDGGGDDKIGATTQTTKLEKIEHVPVFSDDEVDDHKHEEEPPVNTDALDAQPASPAAGGHAGYSVADKDVDPLYNRKASSSRSKRKRSSSSSSRSSKKRSREKHSESSSRSDVAADSDAGQQHKHKHGKHKQKQKRKHNHKQKEAMQQQQQQQQQQQATHVHMHQVDYDEHNESKQERYENYNYENDLGARMNQSHITRQNIDDNSFGCKVMYGYFLKLCGYQHAPPNSSTSYNTGNGNNARTYEEPPYEEFQDQTYDQSYYDHQPGTGAYDYGYQQ